MGNAKSTARLREVESSSGDWRPAGSRPMRPMEMKSPLDEPDIDYFAGDDEVDFLGDSPPTVASLLGYGALLGLVKLGEGVFLVRRWLSRSRRARTPKDEREPSASSRSGVRSSRQRCSPLRPGEI